MKFRLAPCATGSIPRKPSWNTEPSGLDLTCSQTARSIYPARSGPNSALIRYWPGAIPWAFAPTGTASVHGLIKRLFPVADLPPGVIVLADRGNSRAPFLAGQSEVCRRERPHTLDGN